MAKSKALNGLLSATRSGQAKLQKARERYERFLPALSFLAGIVWDVLSLGRFDQWSSLLQLGGYLLAVAVLWVIEIRELERPWEVPPRWARLWRYRDEASHFLLGSLLSAFTIFFLKSSSLIGSLAFFLVIAGALVGNEFSALRRLGLVMRTVLFAICCVSYLACVTPLWFERIGLLPFLTAVGLAGLLFGLALVVLRRGVTDRKLLARRVGWPLTATLAAFLLFYAARLIPPVPLALTHIGIYHGVERLEDGYRVSWTRPDWLFWQRGDQDFVARPGDRIYCFFSVFSPGGFKESLKVRWLYDEPVRGWQSFDAVPVTVTGGREQGYRGFVFKANYRPGNWQIRIETSDAREVGRIYLQVSRDEAVGERELRSKVL